ncbi:MAG TPA: DPP IV N-terminal domain-containing protein, partial [Gemmataceae bacterium]|nr:DPP IV N-terminal domain-containing protein [Gemmataceae bacterium]
MSQPKVRPLPQSPKKTLRELLRRRLAAPVLGMVTLFALAGWWLLPANTQTPTVLQVSLDPQPVKGANFKQAFRYSPEFLRQFVYSTSVTPNWIGKSDSFWYQYNTSKGKQWYRVNSQNAVKEPLFDRIKLGALLSQEIRKPLDPNQLPLTAVSLNDDASKLKFVTDDWQFEYDLRGDKLAKLGKAPAPATGGKQLPPDVLDKLKGMLGDERLTEFLAYRERIAEGEFNLNEASLEEQFADLDMYVQEALALVGEAQPAQVTDLEAQQKKGGKDQKGGKGGQKDLGPKVYSPDKKRYAYAMNNDLYVAEEGKEDEAIRLTKDSAAQYTFNAAVGGQGGGGVGVEQKQLDKEKDKDKDKDKQVRPNVTWSKDSKTFYATRADTRGLKELFLVNSIATPRPTLTRYIYPMPGDENIRKTELHVYHAAKKKLIRVEPKWKDESYSDLHWGKSSDELRFVRSDRLHRNAEFCSINTQTGECKCLFMEGFENSSMAVQPMRYLDETKDSDEMIWWSERSNWGHYYLYDRTGKLKNPITSGDFRASTIVATDTKNRVLYFKGNARERGENVYWNHLYSVRFDGTGLTLLDPGDGDHTSSLSPSRQFVVDNFSRFDAAPKSVLRDARGNKIMDLEHTDLSKLLEVGWRMPETFMVKAADGVTDLYGHMWKPYDFDPKKKYPIIAHVYPGPQTESMTHSFQAISPQAQLAQLNFIVIQVGNRGGTPQRSKNYQSFSYWNMRDYGLADKKTAIEQLASRSPWIDIDRVGIYGHSGGGFMSTAALLVKPYNDFFKVAVSSAGNHDNNVYNNSWAERYHGMKEIPASELDKKDAGKNGPPTKGGKGGKGGKKGGGLDDDFPGDPQTKGDKKDADAKKDAKTDDQKGKEPPKDAKGTEGTKTEKATEQVLMAFVIRVPTNPELAANLKGKLLLVHGDMDNNVHPANTIRMVDALIKANKRFDLLILPGKAHGFAEYQAYFNQRMWEYFAEHLLDDRSTGA